MQPYLIYTICVLVLASVIAAVKVDFADLQSQTWLPGGLIRFRFRPQEPLPPSYRVSIDAPFHSKRPLQNPVISDIGQGWYQMEATIPADAPDSNNWKIVFEKNDAIVNDLAESQNFAISKTGASAPAMNAAPAQPIPVDQNLIPVAPMPTIPPPPPPPQETLIINQPIQQVETPFWMQQPTPILPNPMDQSSIVQPTQIPTQVPSSMTAETPSLTAPVISIPTDSLNVNPVNTAPMTIVPLATSDSTSLATNLPIIPTATPMELTVNPVPIQTPATVSDMNFQSSIVPSVTTEVQSNMIAPSPTSDNAALTPVQTFIYVVPPPDQAQLPLPDPPAAAQGNPQAAQQPPVYIVVPNPGNNEQKPSSTDPSTTSDSNSNIYDYTGGQKFD